VVPGGSGRASPQTGVLPVSGLAKKPGRLIRVMADLRQFAMKREIRIDTS
jgi:hypothetical protein